MKVIMPLGDVRCGHCGYVMSQAALDQTGLRFSAVCRVAGCVNRSLVVHLTPAIVDAPVVAPVTCTACGTQYPEGAAECDWCPGAKLQAVA